MISDHLRRRQRLLISPSRCDYIRNASSFSLSSILSSSNQPINDSTRLVCPFQENPNSVAILHAVCNELWCIEVESSLFLWNPCINTYKQIADPSLPPWPGIFLFQFAYGLGYDSTGDDYKILKVCRVKLDPPEIELYSLKSNAWRKTQPFAGNFPFLRGKGVSISGALHWMVHHDGSHVIVSFDLSTEKFGEVAPPEYSPRPSPEGDGVEVTALRGMLCVCLNYRDTTGFVLWVMKVYGVGKSWTKQLHIDYYNGIPLFPADHARTASSCITMSPSYFFDNGEVLIKVFTAPYKSEIFVYTDEKTVLQKIVGPNNCPEISDGFVYVGSLISPALWAENRRPPRR